MTTIGGFYQYVKFSIELFVIINWNVQFDHQFEPIILLSTDGNISVGVITELIQEVIQLKETVERQGENNTAVGKEITQLKEKNTSLAQEITQLWWNSKRTAQN